MKRIFSFALAIVLVLALVGCGDSKEPFNVEQDTEALLAGGAFSEELEEMDKAIFVRLYGLDEEKLTDGKVYGSTGATAEEVAVLEFDGEEAAKAAVALCEERLAYLKESNESYRPQEMPKLEKAVIRQIGNTVLFLVANDYDAACVKNLPQ